MSGRTGSGSRSVHALCKNPKCRHSRADHIRRGCLDCGCKKFAGEKKWAK